MGQKRSRAVIHHKGLEPKYVPRQGGRISLGYYTNIKGKPKVQLPTKVGPKEENYRAPLQKDARNTMGTRVTPGTCGATGVKAQVILVWVRAPGVWNASHPWRLEVMRVKP
jgi:hypothetical protein